MLKRVLLGLSRSALARKWVTEFPPLRRAARRFVAGETLEEGIEAVRSLNQQGISASLDQLGENTRTHEEATRAATEYREVLNAIDRAGVDAGISLKPTQLGLALSRDLCLENLESVMRCAQQRGVFVRIDMESSPYVDGTLWMYEQLREAGYENVGVVIQSYLYRSREDMERLAKRGANVRVCKGAYAEPAEVAYPKKRDADRNFAALLEQLWSLEARERGAFAAVATHDERIIRWAERYVREQEIPQDRFEFQMLYGVRRDLQRSLAERGYPVRVYVSYGREWYPYFMRRLAERPANLLFLARQASRG